MKTFRQFILEMDVKVRPKAQVIRVERPTPPPRITQSKIVDSPNAVKNAGSVLGAIRSLRSPAALAGAALGNILSSPPNPTAKGTLDAAKERGDYKYKSRNADGPIGKGGEKYL